MENLIKNDRIKVLILKELNKEGKLTPSKIASKLLVKYETVKKSLDFFESLKIVNNEVVKHGEKNYIYYQLTKLGKEVSKNAWAY